MTQRSRRGLALWLTSSQTPIFVLDERRVLLVFNHGCEQLSQWTAAEVIGKTCQFRSEANPQLVTSLTGALCPPPNVAVHDVTTQPTVFHRRDGTILEREIHFFPLRSDEDPSKVHLLGIITSPQAAPRAAPDRHFEVGRHMAELYAKYGTERIVARSPEMQKVASQIELARSHPTNVHFRGERGTGKEHLARLIHYGSGQRTLRFVPVRCHTATHFELRSLLERLTDEQEHTHVGTVYLGAVQSLPGDLQQFLVDRLDQSPIRWMSSSPGRLSELPDDVFSPMLSARLTPLTIYVPPLRKRSADLLLLAQQLLEESNSLHSRQCTGMTEGVQRLFRQYDWPGNVDELANVIARACTRCRTEFIDVEDLPFDFAAGLHGQSMRPIVPPRSLDEQLEDFERSQLVRALEAAGGNKSLAAERLGVTRPRLYRRLAHFDLAGDPPEVGEIDLDEGNV